MARFRFFVFQPCGSINKSFILKNKSFIFETKSSVFKNKTFIYRINPLESLFLLLHKLLVYSSVTVFPDDNAFVWKVCRDLSSGKVVMCGRAAGDRCGVSMC